MVQHGVTRYGRNSVFCDIGLGQPHQRISYLGTWNGFGISLVQPLQKQSSFVDNNFGCNWIGAVSGGAMHNIYVVQLLL